MAAEGIVTGEQWVLRDVWEEKVPSAAEMEGASLSSSASTLSVFVDFLLAFLGTAALPSVALEFVAGA